MKNLRKSQAQFREKLRKLMLRRSIGFLIKENLHPISTVFVGFLLARFFILSYFVDVLKSRIEQQRVRHSMQGNPVAYCHLKSYHFEFISLS